MQYYVVVTMERRGARQPNRTSPSVADSISALNFILNYAMEDKGFTL